MKALALIAVIAATPAAACDLRPDEGAILLGSNHINADIDFNEENLGVFLSWECGGIDTRAGFYNNSFEDTSFALTFKADALTYEVGEMGIAPFLGVAHYPDAQKNMSIHWNGWVPIGGIEVTAGPVFAQIIPGHKDTLGYSAIAAFGLRMDF